MVYVDNMNMPYGRMIMCHMIADSTEELLHMADKIGVNRKWIQYEGTPKEHFDICLSARQKAIKLGAKQITWRQLGEMTIARYKNLNNNLNNTNQDEKVSDNAVEEFPFDTPEKRTGD